MAHPEQLSAAREYLQDQWSQQGYTPELQKYDVDGQDAYNIEVEVTGATRPLEIVVLGAHYDSHDANPGADDNASGVAVMLATSKFFAGSRPDRTVRFVAFTNEEPPYFKTEAMGSAVYARRSRDRDEQIVGMIALDCVGYFSDEPESQHYPWIIAALYPSTGNFIGFVSRPRDRDVMRQAQRGFSRATDLAVEHIVAPATMPGIDWSDHWSFWQQKYPALMISDTALYRNSNYHTQNDRADTIDYPRLAKVAQGVIGSIDALATFS